MGKPRGGVDRSLGTFVASLTIAKIRRANVGPNEQGVVDAFNTQSFPGHPDWPTPEQISA
jgi:hypothetical protein